MALLTILEYPDSRLRKIAAPVDVVDDALRQLLDDMLETMYAAPGIGLAATQVDIHQRFLVVDLSEGGDSPLFLINPEITGATGKEIGEEGCLSVPGVNELVERADQISLKALGRDGEPIEMQAEGLLAVCIQHEIDHLDGKLFVDYLSELKRQRLRKKAAKSSKYADEDRSKTGSVPNI